MEEVVLDTNALIDLMDLGCLEALAAVPGFRVWVAENVRKEIIRDEQKEQLDRLFASGLIRETKVGEEVHGGMEELATYTKLKDFLGDGEAASLAVAHHRGWVFVSYEKGRLRREAKTLLGGRFWTTPSLLAAMVRVEASTLAHLEAAAAMGGPVQPGSASKQAEHLSRLVAEAQGLISHQWTGDPP